jgi:hypothetical protein
VASLDARFKGRGLQVIGVQSPEFDVEKDPAGVKSAARMLGITWPVFLDNDLKVWDALDNRYWPTQYLLDRSGAIREVHVGEVHAGDDDAKRIEARIAALLDEPAAGKPAP